MAPSLFLTGATGYIGGSTLDVLYSRFPDVQFTVLLRSPNTEFSSRYPEVKIEYGSYSDLELLENLAASHDIIMRCGYTDDLPTAQAMLKGCARRQSTSYFIHLTGTGTLSDPTYVPTGELNPKVWSDIDNIRDIQTLPDSATHRNVDKAIQEFAALHGDTVKTAIVCPPDIYGVGTGIGKKQSFMVPFLTKEILDRGYAFYLGKGENLRCAINVLDLAELFAVIVEDAIKGGNKVGWGNDAFFFATTQELSGKDIGVAAGRIFHQQGLIESPEPKSIPVEEASNMLSDFAKNGNALYLFGFHCDTRSRPDRTKKQLGWESKHPSFWDQLEADILTSLESKGTTR